MYYKFRDLKDYKYIVDIFLNQRLYLASYRKLNDNFEGQFFSHDINDTKRYRLNPKRESHISICSFSGGHKSHLMWLHYANGHKGIAIGFEINKSKYNIEKVKYNGLSSFSEFPQRFDDLKTVFLNKIKEWEYEEEYRIISEKQGYADIEIKEVIFGSETSDHDKSLISKLAELINPKIKIKTYYG